ncbi:MAG: amidase [Gemmatimonadota bacterium]
MIVRPFHQILILATGLLAAGCAPSDDAGLDGITEDEILAAEEILGLTFTPEERSQMLERQQFFQDLSALRESYGEIRAAAPDQSVMPAISFVPGPLSWELPARDEGPLWSPLPTVTRPEPLEKAAYWSIAELGALLRTGQATSVELTRMYLDRIEQHDRSLELVVTLLEDEALAQAATADAELAAGTDRGPLHGIPYVLKDLFALEGYPTTWGVWPAGFEEMEGSATVATELAEAGAVLLAKVSLGALAWGDVWFGGRTRNPWNLEEGSSGSSAGSAASVSAGLAPFGIGTETWGSIVSPSATTGVTGLRPTFGRVSRAGAMAVSWSMDKVGPICRFAEDCGMVLDAMRGADGIDPSAVDAPFNYEAGVDWSAITVGYVDDDFEGEGSDVALDLETLEVLRALGASLVPIDLPERPIGPLSLILGAEAAASFDRITLSNRDDELPRQVVDAWPNVLRSARLIPAAEYIQANRIRTLLGRDMRDLFAEVDVYVAPSGRGDSSLLTNLTGHPAIAVPNGMRDPDSPNSITFMGRLYDEATLLGVARAYQEATDFHLLRPPLFVP